MASIPRVITVDPQSVVARLVHAAVNLFDRPVVQVDVPGSREALDEIARGGYQLAVAALHIDRHMQGDELAERVRQMSPETAVLILADGDVPDALDADSRADSPFIVFRRPVDAGHFMAVVHAALLGRDIHSVIMPASRPAPLTPDDFGPVPALDLKAANVIVETLLADVGARTIILSSRSGDVLLERGVPGTLDRIGLAQALPPTVGTIISMRDLTGSHVDSLQYFDSDGYDVFVLSAGYHHFLSLIFDGQAGARQFGAVTRFGRRAAEDLKALLGSAAHTLHTRPAAPPPVENAEPSVEAPADVVEPVAVKAETWEPDDTPPAPEPEPQSPADPIADFDLSILDGLAALDTRAADDLFNPDRLAEIASETRHGGGPLTYEEARELGIVP